MRFEIKDHYKTLGINPDEFPDLNDLETKIKEAYRKLSLQYHPDKSSGKADKMAEVSKAYEILSDRDKRSEYEQKVYLKYFGDQNYVVSSDQSHSSSFTAPYTQTSQNLTTASTRTTSTSSTSRTSNKSQAVVTFNSGKDFFNLNPGRLKNLESDELRMVIMQAQDVLERELAIRTPDNHQKEEIRRFIEEGHLERLKEYIDHNGFTEPKTLTFYVLHAASLGNLEVCKLLIEQYYTNYKEFVDQEYGGMSCLKAACASGNIKLVEYLLSKNPEWEKVILSDDPGDSYGSPLNHAVKKGKLEMAKFLLNKGMKLSAHPTLQNDAMISGSIDMVKFLMLKGTFRIETCNFGIALENGHFELVNYFLNQYGKNLSQLNLTNHPALLAVKGGNLSVITLLKQSYDVSLLSPFSNRNGDYKPSAEDYLKAAMKSDNAEMIDFLINGENLLDSYYWIESPNRTSTIEKLQRHLFEKVLVAPNRTAISLLNQLFNINSDIIKELWEKSVNSGIQVNALINLLLNRAFDSCREHKDTVNKILLKLAADGLASLTISELSILFAFDIVQTKNEESFIKEIAEEAQKRNISDVDFYNLVNASDDLTKNCLFAYYCSEHSTNDRTKLEILLKAGVDPNRFLPNGSLPLMVTISDSRIFNEKVNLLLENGADPLKTTFLGEMPLSPLVRDKKYIDYLANSNNEDAKTAALIKVCDNYTPDGATESIYKLLKAGANPNKGKEAELPLLKVIKKIKESSRNSALFKDEIDFICSPIYSLLEYGAKVPEGVNRTDKDWDWLIENAFYLDFQNGKYKKEDASNLISEAKTTASSSVIMVSTITANPGIEVHDKCLYTNAPKAIKVIDKSPNLGGNVSDIALDSLITGNKSKFLEKVDARNYDPSVSDFQNDTEDEAEKNILELKLKSLLKIPLQGLAVLKTEQGTKKMVFALNDIPAHTVICFFSGTFIKNQPTSSKMPMIGYDIINKYFNIIDHRGIASYLPHLPSEKKYDDVKELSVDLRMKIGHTPSQKELKLNNELYTLEFYDTRTESSIATANLYLERILYQGIPVIALITGRNVKKGELVGFDHGVNYWLQSKTLPTFYDNNGKEIPKSSYIRNFYQLSFGDYTYTGELGSLLEQVSANEKEITIKTDQNSEIKLSKEQVLDELDRVNGIHQEQFASLMKQYFKEKYKLSDVAQIDLEGCLRKAVQESKFEDVSRLVKIVQNIAAPNKDNQTALHLAAINGDSKIYNSLLRKGPSNFSEMEDKHNKTAYDYIKEREKNLQDSSVQILNASSSSYSSRNS